MHCPFCGRKNPDDGAACVQCAAPLTGFRESWPDQAPTESEVPQKSLTRKERLAAARTQGPRAHQDDDDVGFVAGDIILSIYVIEKQLGRGGMGTVYLGRDDVSGQRVAIKVLPGALAKERDIRDRFIQEARALAALDHPGIVPLITFAQEGDDRFLVMKYVGGRTLDAQITEQRVLACDEARRVVRELVTALGYAHDHGVVHRDIKPANVVVGEDGRVVLVDFGIARKLEGAAFVGKGRLTQTGMLMGTPQYMSPEQIEGKPVDGRADLYACGLLLFEMLTGGPPFDGDKTFDVLKAHVEKPVPDVRDLRRCNADVDPMIPDDLVALVHALLQKDPKDRPQTGKAVLDILDGKVTLTGPSSSSPPAARETKELRPITRPTSQTPALAFQDHDDDDDDPIDVPSNPAVRWAASFLLLGIVGAAAIAVMANRSDVVVADVDAGVVPVAAIIEPVPTVKAPAELVPPVKAPVVVEEPKVARKPVKKARAPKVLARPAELSDQALGAITSSSKARSSRCYVEHLLSIDSTAEGEVTLAVTIATTGTVTRAAVKKSAFSSSEFHDCLIEAVKLWKFQAFDGDDDVVIQKLRFKPG
ncbi:MAG: protein kinase [Deltaproteobacteria bacterium]|nr:protein kinase [Deltaproteobacteria bacterium]